MHECVSVHVGGAGVRLGGSLWPLLCAEHDLAPSADHRAGQAEGRDCATDAPEALFTLSEAGRYTPRALLVDNEPSAIDEVRKGYCRDLFPPGQLVTGKEDAANCYARAYYRQDSSGLVDMKTVMEQIRKTTEICDDLQGFLIFHSLGGGTGAGTTSAVMEHLTAEYPRQTKITFAVFSSDRYMQSTVQPYNCVLASHAMMPHADCTFLLDNDAVVDLCAVKGKIRHPSLDDVNSLTAQVTSSVTLGLRSSGPFLSTLQEFPVNLVPFPRLHFPLVSYAPVMDVEQPGEDLESPRSLTLSCLDAESHLQKCDPRKGRYAACCLLYRGDVTPVDVNTAIAYIKARRKFDFVDWCPTGFKIGINPKGPYASPGQRHFGVPRSALCMLASNSAIAELWGTLTDKFDLMFAKGAFLHWYLSEGMDMEQLVDARNDLAALEKEYGDLFASTWNGSNGSKALGHKFCPGDSTGI
ncbi:tubulin alpha-4 chain-like isoform X2 [Eriocheir sinensis]|uniref:tubulin alpha-4 chain-like isoform X2 n=1 Tax=Eriocheir sinensis TaxID=95602 RepID=UPI0021C9D947|nr:tubulin alpha-4 chain-like isoform X2 [Eriocheir sinensis]